MNSRTALLAVIILGWLGSTSAAFGQGTAFTYQGRLQENGNAAEGIYDLRFAIYDSAGGLNIVGGPVTNSAVSVSRGLFTAALDFGSDVFTGADRWLEIGVRTNGSAAAFTTLSARQPITPLPYALHAANANALMSFINAPLDIKVNGARMLRLEQTGSNSVNVVGGYAGNTVASGIVGATIGGGGAGDYFGFNFGNRVEADFGTVGGGIANVASNGAATVSGGQGNIASGSVATVGGGDKNTASAVFATVGGGSLNDASGTHATIGGGYRNVASGLETIVGGGLENTASGDVAAVAGGWKNVASASGASIVGGRTNVASGLYASVGGGASNIVSGNYAIVAGGLRNKATNSYATISGGEINTAGGSYATIGGGRQNTASGSATIAGGNHNTADSSSAIGGGSDNIARSSGAAIAGGQQNTATNATAAVAGGFANVAGGNSAMVPGGQFNHALGDGSFAAGLRAKANHDGGFVWADSQGVDFSSQRDDQFRVRAAGGARFDINGSHWIDMRLDLFPSSRILDTSSGAFLSTGGSWVNGSDAARKENFRPVDARMILAALAALPLSEWNYKAEDNSSRHIGPTAQDFHAAFGFGADDKHIATVDADGVALAAIQGLNQKVEEREAALREELKRTAAENTELKERMVKLEKLVSLLTPNVEFSTK
jgi:trimeric autotransporter adhesin